MKSVQFYSLIYLIRFPSTGEHTNPRKTNPANNRKWQSPCYSGKKIRNWHICEIVETKMAKSVL